MASPRIPATQHTREIAIRMALGAQPVQVIFATIQTGARDCYIWSDRRYLRCQRNSKTGGQLSCKCIAIRSLNVCWRVGTVGCHCSARVSPSRTACQPRGPLGKNRRPSSSCCHYAAIAYLFPELDEPFSAIPCTCSGVSWAIRLVYGGRQKEPNLPRRRLVGKPPINLLQARFWIAR
jgi:hypothetical protein